MDHQAAKLMRERSLFRMSNDIPSHWPLHFNIELNNYEPVSQELFDTLLERTREAKIEETKTSRWLSDNLVKFGSFVVELGKSIAELER